MDILHGNRLLFGNSMVVMHTLFIHLTPLCLRICSSTVTYDWFPVIVRKSWRVPHVGQEMLILPEHMISLPLGEFMIHQSTIQNCQSKEYVYGVMTYYWLLCRGLIVVALSWTIIFSWQVGISLMPTYTSSIGLDHVINSCWASTITTSNDIKSTCPNLGDMVCLPLFGAHQITDHDTVPYNTNHVYLHRFSRLRFCVCV